MAGSRVVLGLHRSGREVPLVATISRLEGGRTLGVCLHDATERAALELAQEERLARTRQLADELPVLISYLDEELRCRFVNGALEAWTGRRRAALEDRDARTLVRPEVWTRVEPLLQEALNGVDARFRERVRDASGRTREIDVLVVPAEERHGGIDGVYVVAVPLARVAHSKRIHTLMAEAGRLLAVSVEPLLSLSSVLSLVVAEYAERAEAGLKRAADQYRVLRAERGQVGRHRMLSRRQLPLGLRLAQSQGVACAFSSLKDRRVHVVQPISADHHRDLGALELSWTWPYDPGADDRDLVEDLATRIGVAFERAAALREAREAALHRDWALEKALHDLSGPTASIWMAADRMLRSAPEPDRRARSRAHLEGIAQQAKELERLILDLRAATELRSGHAMLVRENTRLDQVVADVVGTLAPLAEWHDTTLRVQAGVADVEVVADPYHLRRLLSALLMNAVRHSGPGASVEIGYQVRQGTLVVEVRGPEEACPEEESDAHHAPARLDLGIARELAVSQETAVALIRAGTSCVASFTLPLAS
jgi:PAS domain S-box-containing protein